MLVAVVSQRLARTDDRAFLEEMLAIAADWRELVPRPVAEVLAVPKLGHYVQGWPATGDFGLVAEDEGPVGAAWWRYSSADDPGYGFVDEVTPELAIGVVPEARGAGIGTRLLEALIGAGRDRSLPGLSLSVDVANPAQRLYQRLGFSEVGMSGGSATMLLQL